MACNCKRANEISEKYGEQLEDNIFTKIVRFFWKIIFFIIGVSLGLILSPIIVVIAIYKMFFSSNNTIVLPKFLSKYLK